MKFNFYVATHSLMGLVKGKHYFVGADNRVFLQNENRVPFFILRRILKPIASYEGQLKEEWRKEKKEIQMGVLDLFSYEEMSVKLIEVHEKKNSMVCLAQIPGSEEYVQIDVTRRCIA